MIQPMQDRARDPAAEHHNQHAYLLFRYAPLFASQPHPPTHGQFMVSVYIYYLQLEMKSNGQEENRQQNKQIHK